MVAHVITVENAVNEQKRLDEAANRVFPCRTPGDAGMLDATRIQGKEIGVKGYHDAPADRGKRELFRILQATAFGVLRGQDINTVLP